MSHYEQGVKTDSVFKMDLTRLVRPADENRTAKKQKIRNYTEQEL